MICGANVTAVATRVSSAFECVAHCAPMISVYSRYGYVGGGFATMFCPLDSHRFIAEPQIVERGASSSAFI